MFDQINWMEQLAGSPVMIVLLFCSIATLGFAVERGLYLWRRRGQPDRTLGEALEMLKRGRVQEADRVLRLSPHPMGAVASRVVRSAHLVPEAQEEVMGIALSEERMRLEHNLGILGTMGSTAPLIGLLGTVYGIMRAFHDMSATGSAGPSVVAAGVAEALLTTGAGLIVAVPAVMLYNHFARRIQVMLGVAENHARAVRLAIEEKSVAALPEDSEASQSSVPVNDAVFTDYVARAA